MIVLFDGLEFDGDYHCFGKQGDPKGILSDSGDAFDMEDSDRVFYLGNADDITIWVRGEPIYSETISALLDKLSIMGVFHDQEILWCQGGTK